MDKKTSIYLDFLRIIATFSVFIGHFSYKQFSGNYLNRIGMFAHDAVIIFFVLSGFVIAFVSENKDRFIKKYLINRASRIYSVLLPALILTIILDFIGMSFNSKNYEVYGPYTLMEILKKTFANGLFLQEVANKSIRFFSNGPLWSLGYEVIYYVLFGLIYFKGKSKMVKIITIFVMLIFYKVTLLFPIWLFGVVVYKLKDKFIFSTKISYIIFIITPMLFLILKKVGVLTLIDFPSLGYSRYVLGDYIIGLLLSLNILASKNIKLNLLEKCSSAIKYMAGFSFSIYLYHFPILVFLISVFNYNVNNIIMVTSVGVIAIILCFIISLFTEKKKYIYRKYFSILLNM